MALLGLALAIYNDGPTWLLRVYWHIASMENQILSNDRGGLLLVNGLVDRAVTC